MDQEISAQISNLTKMVELGFAAVADDIFALRTELKTDIAGLSEQVSAIERELSTIRRDLDELAGKVDNVLGYRKEIDHALDRIAAIERHLGINRKIAA